MSRSTNKISDSFNKINSLVIGDVMLDTYLFGSVTRISPEAPVPIVDIENIEHRLGGAANVAINIQSLGGNAVICSMTGNDSAGKRLFKLLAENKLNTNNVMVSRSRITTEKTRVFSRNQQMLRYDQEIKRDLSAGDEKKLTDRISKLIFRRKFDVVVLQDYNKGVLTPKVIRTTIDLCLKKKIPVIVDPKKNNFFEYKDVTLFKPNLREVNDVLGIEADKKSRKSLDNTAKSLHSKLHNLITLITLSEGGVFITDHQSSKLIPATVRNIADVSGAGDTVLSAVALCVATGMDLATTGILANIAGGLACEQVGVIPINREQFFSEVNKALS